MTRYKTTIAIDSEQHRKLKILATIFNTNFPGLVDILIGVGISQLSPEDKEFYKHLANQSEEDYYEDVREHYALSHGG